MDGPGRPCLEGDVASVAGLVGGVGALHVMLDRGVGSWIERRARIAPDHPALIHGAGRCTYGELAIRVRAVADARNAADQTALRSALVDLAASALSWADGIRTPDASPMEVAA